MHLRHAIPACHSLHQSREPPHPVLSKQRETVLILVINGKHSLFMHRTFSP
jgi:hypothetical protein